MKHNYFIYLISCFCAFLQISNAQVTTQSISSKNLEKYVKFHSQMAAPIVEMPYVDVAKFRLEDAKSTNKELPPRYGVPIEVDLGLGNGVWEVSPAAGGMIWKLAVKSIGATTLNIFFDKFHLPEGAILYAYNADRTRLFGPVTSVQNNNSNNLATTLLKGDMMILELFEPINRKGKSELHISHVVHGYIDITLKGNPAGSPGSIGTCHNDVTCPEGANFQNEVDAVAMIIYPVNARGASGTLLNDACNNLRPNFLTAFHNIDLSEDGEISDAERAITQKLLFAFNYKTSTCNGIENNMSISLMGADLVSSFNETDFALLRLKQSPIAGSGIRFSGWDRSGAVPGTTVGIHHPNGNVMKISLDSNSPGISRYLQRSAGLATSYWRVLWDDGTTEPGSSGSGLFNNQNRIIGQLKGGSASCTQTDSADYYGRLSMSWGGGGTSTTRLEEHLSDDPSVMTTNTIGIPSFSIPDELCGNVPFTLANLPPNMSLVGGSFVGANLTGWFSGIEPQQGFNGLGHLELRFKPNGITCDDPLIIRKNFWVGPPQPNASIIENDGDCFAWLSVSNPQPNTSYTWKVTRGPSWYTYYLSGSNAFLHNWGPNYAWVSYELTATNSCGSNMVTGGGTITGCDGLFLNTPIELPPSDLTAKAWKMQLSPNPVRHDLNIALTDYEDRLLFSPVELRVMNSMGQVVHQSKKNVERTMQLDVQNLNSGFYILEIKGIGFSMQQKFNVTH
jgi:lysyl endopeptidase